MEQSTTPRVQRQLSFLQSFGFLLRHILGKRNGFADWQSRQGFQPASTPEIVTDVLLQLLSSDFTELSDDATDLPLQEPLLLALDAPAPPALVPAPTHVENVTFVTSHEIMVICHDGRSGHGSVIRTYKRANKLFPGHNIPFRAFEDYVAKCPTCQKARLGHNLTIPPQILNLMPPHQRRTLGVDGLTVTPTDRHGNSYVVVLVVHATKLTGLYAFKTKDALSTATAIFLFIVTYGLFDELASDPGSDLTSEVVEHLTRWLGMGHKFSLVDRHQSNGVEGTNKEVLRYLHAIISDERVLDNWSDSTVLPWVQYIINSEDSYETGISPFAAHFGTASETYFKLPQCSSETETTAAYVKLLDANLNKLRQISSEHRSAIVKARAAAQLPEAANSYQPGDFVLLQRNPNQLKPTKLSYKYLGPYEVITQTKNDVQCRHMNNGICQTFHVERLKLFVGSREDGRRMAMLDHDQHVIDAILHFRGDPMQRTNMEFYVRFADGTSKWLTWTQDLFASVPYETYCRSRPELFPLLHSVAISATIIRELNATNITEVQPGAICYVDMRWFSATYYTDLDLPDCHTVTYVMEVHYDAWVNRGNHKKIHATFVLTEETFPVDHYFVKHWGYRTQLDESVILFTAALALRYPAALPDSTRTVLLTKLRRQVRN
jgi:hypothetical protein